MTIEDSPTTPSPGGQPVRLGKLLELKRLGILPYPNDFKPDTTLADLRARAVQLGDPPDPAALGAITARVAGRLMLLRDFGKLTFARLQDESGTLQIAVQREEVGADFYREVFRKLVEVGDLVGVEGALFLTKTGELTLRTTRLQLLAKALRQLPEKFHGLEDVETRYRQRYVDLIINPESRALFLTRCRIIREIRRCMEEHGFLEVETPMMHPIPGGATARPFITRHHALQMDLYLRVAPELYLKRLVVGGLERVFEINRNFRNEGLSVRHNPEFTMMEFYQAYADYRELMTFTEMLISRVALAVLGRTQVVWQGESIELAPPWRRLTLAEAVAQPAGVSPETAADPVWLRERVAALGLPPGNGEAGALLLALFEAEVEKGLIQPTFICDYPISVSPLSRRSDQRPEIAERFELFIGGWEIANAFSELNDPVDQAERFRRQVAAKEGGDLEAMHYDADYIRALEYGMPPTAGEGIGIDRLVMLLTGAASIREVLLFPHLRPEAKTCA